MFLKGYSTQNFNFEKYTNDFIDEMHYKWFFLFDSDIVFDKQDLINFLSQIRKSKNNIMFYFAGINILKDEKNNIGFSDGSDSMELKPFVGVGDFLCYVPIYNASNKRYFYKSNSKAKNGINLKYYSVKNVGLRFLHLSLLKYKISFVKPNFSIEEISRNIENNKMTNYEKIYYKKIIKKSNPNTIKKLLFIKKLMSSFISKLFLD